MKVANGVFLSLPFILIVSSCGGGGGAEFVPGGGATATATGIIPDSGQAECYYDYTIDSFYNPTSSTCLSPGSGWSPDGQDGNFSINTPSYIDNNDGTVNDSITGLLWQKCSLGESGTDCATGSASSFVWSDAVSQCANLNLMGTGWRLPDAFELTQLVDYGSSSTSINSTVFPGTNPAPYWTSSVHAAQSAWAWYVSFSQGNTWVNNKTETYKVRCVRG